MKRGKMSSEHSQANFRAGQGIHPRNRISQLPRRGGIRL